MKFKKLLILGFLLMALVALPVSFAADVDSIDLNSNFNSNSNLAIQDYQINSDLNNSYENNIQSEDIISTNDNLNADSETIYINGSYTGSSEDGTLAKPFKTINKAMDAFLDSGASNLFIANGDYTISESMDITKDINIIGESSNVMINANRQYLFAFGNCVVNIYNLTIYNGFSTTIEIIKGISSNISLYNTVLRNNYAESPGGILNIKDGELSLFNCSILDNFINYFVDEEANVTGGISGGIIYSSASTLNIINSLFENNTINSTSYAGGFIYCSDINCINSTFSDVYINATEVNGGIIYLTGKMNFINSSISNVNINSSKIYGAFISCNSKFNESYMINSSFKNSKFTNIFGLIYSPGFINIKNCDISNNYAEVIQGNLIVYDEYNISTIDNLTIVNNTFGIISYNLSDINIMYRADIFILSPEDIESIPSSYDLREYGLVTSVKDQSGSGSCWTFASIAALESYLLKTYNLSTDLSENNMRIIMSSDAENGSLWDADIGGNDILAISYLLRWSGAINESDDSFDPSDREPKYDLPVSQHVQGVVYLPLRVNYLDNDQIKWAIMKYGALYTSTNADIDFYYSPESKSIAPNHAVAIVGWDDNYVIEGAPGPGAFIIKNSWGSIWGEDGFFYISYYAPCFAGFASNTGFSAIAFTDVENTSNYDSIYQYDIFGNDNHAVGFSSNEGWFANEFTANNYESLSAFGIYSYGYSNYSAYIYVNGKLVHTQEGTVSTTYQTIKLTKSIKLNKGDKFKIVIKLITPNCLHPIAIESPINGFINATANPNESFVSSDGVNWIDLTSIYENANVCLKAYTKAINYVSMTITQTNTYYKSTYLTVTLSDNISDMVINLKFSNGKSVDLVTKNGVATYYVPFAVGNYTVTGTIVNESYGGEDFTLNFKINKATATISTYKLSTTYYSGDYFKVKVTDNKGKVMVGVKLTLKVYTGSKYKTVTVTTGEDGYAKYSASTLSIAKHKVIVSSAESTKYMTAKSKTNYITISKGKTTVVAPKVTNKCGLNQYFTINVTRTIKKTPINSLALTVKVYNSKGKVVKTYSVKTNSNGIASINTKNLAAGTYKVVISSSNKYYTVSKTVNSGIVMQKQKVSVVAPSVTNIYGKNQYFKINANKVDNGNVISGLALTVKVYKGSKLVKTYSVKTNSNGSASINTKSLATGTYTFKVTSANSKYTVSSSNIGKLIMTKYKTNIVAPQVNNTYKKSQYFKVNVTRQDTGNPISSLSIVVKVYKGSKLVKTYSTTTNTNGTASINTKDLAKGNYKVVISTKNVSYTVSKTITDAIKIK